MIIEAHGKTFKVSKEQFYCKAGPYEHKYRTGWVAEDLSSGRIYGDYIAPSPHGAEGYEWPEFKTRKELVEAIENDWL